MRQIRSEAVGTYGKAWGLLSERQRQGEMALVALQILSGQDESVPDARVRAMITELASEVFATGEG